MVMIKIIRKRIWMCLILAKYSTSDAKAAWKQSIYLFLPPPQPEPAEQGHRMRN